MAQTMVNSALVTPQWLKQHLETPELVIIDCRFQLADPQWGYQQYCLGHIPGAHYLDLERHLSGLVRSHGGRHPLPDTDTLAHTLARLGITLGQTWVVAYDDARFAFAARLWWLMRFLGHDRVALLDGGWHHWLAQGYSVICDMPTVEQQGQFVPHERQGWVVDLPELKALMRSPNVTVIDSRDHERYLGIREPMDPVAGHIPGAVNSPWHHVCDASGLLRPLSHQQQLWQTYTEASTCIVYCGSGVTACVNLFSMFYAGLTQAKLYPGGWSDWCTTLP